MLVYLGRKDLFTFCEDGAAEEKAQAVFAEVENGEDGNELLMYHFFVRSLKGDTAGWRRRLVTARRRFWTRPDPPTWTASLSGGGSCCGPAAGVASVSAGHSAKRPDEGFYGGDGGVFASDSAGGGVRYELYLYAGVAVAVWLPGGHRRQHRHRGGDALVF